MDIYITLLGVVDVSNLCSHVRGGFAVESHAVDRVHVLLADRHGSSTEFLIMTLLSLLVSIALLRILVNFGAINI